MKKSTSPSREKRFHFYSLTKVVTEEERQNGFLYYCGCIKVI